MTSRDPVTTLRRTLVELGWEPEQRSESTFYIDFGHPHMPVADAIAAVVVDSRQFVLYINLGAAAPANRRDEVGRFITRANWGLTIGNFELDYDDGHVRFKSSVAFDGRELSEATIRNAIFWAMNAVETYAEALVEVIAGEKEAEQAITDVEA
jgi:hypothetical protein